MLISSMAAGWQRHRRYSVQPALKLSRVLAADSSPFLKIYPDTSQYPPPYLSCDHVQGVTKAFYELRPHQNGPNCTGNFMTFFNSYYGTSLTYQQLVDWAQNNCYLDFSVCGNGGESEEEYPLVTEAYAPAPHVSPLMLCDSGDPAGEPEDDDPCDDVPGMANNAAYEIFNHYVSEINNNFNNSYRSVCLGVAGLEHFTVSYNNPEFHYTLYYYDQAGNLVKTIPPSGVSADFSQAYYNAVKAYRANPNLSRPPSPGHSLATSYRYNSLNAVVEQYSPDGGLSKFYYDKLGRLTLSQNGKQSLTDSYSYTIYDGLGRIEEVGETEIAGGITQTAVQMAEDPSTLVPPERTEITHTGYDAAYISETHFAPLFRPGYLRGRVSYSWVKDSYNDVNYRMGTFYSYDAHGNVKTLFHDYHEGVMEEGGNAFKRMDYEYDLVSGKVKEVRYQDGEADAFYHRYRYDGENRLKMVETSRDKILWQRDAKYGYYKHGPVARLELGELQVQGVDYAYTLHGWLKGINSTGVGDGAFDMGADGKTGSSNSNIARDAYGVSLNYYEGDYKPIGSSVTPFAGISVGSDLFNGNIKSMVLNIPKLGDGLAYVYRYDQLNRLTKMDAYEGLNNATNVFTPVGMDAYQERLSYDANGNIATYLRKSETGAARNDYQYTYTAGTNRLAGITNSVNAQTKNYAYDEIGNTTEDGMQGMSNGEWNVYGKLRSLTNAQSQHVTYTYGSDGHRISKTVGDVTEWYVCDAMGNIMATYKKDPVLNHGDLTVTEQYKYGSGLLSVRDARINVESPVVGGTMAFERGNDNYILSDQNGNTKVTVSDKKIPHSTDGVTIDYYTAEVRTATLHSSYGANAKTYNGGLEQANFNGQRKSLEIGEDAQTALYWEYNGDVGRRWNRDPKIKFYESGYAAFGNNPIGYIDKNGADTIDVKSKTYDVNGKKATQKGFDKNNMMVLFTTHTDEKSGMNSYGDAIEIRRSMGSDKFNEKYSISGAVAVGDLDGQIISRTPASLLSVNLSHPTAFFDAITYVKVADIEALRKRALVSLSNSNFSWLFSRGFDKWRYFRGGATYDIKSNLLKGRSYSYVEGIGMMESDFIGNMFYGASMGNYQSLANSLHDGDFLQQTGIDDAFDSHAIIVGYKYGRTGITINTFKSISNIILDKSTISNGKFYHTYDINDKGESTQIKVNN